MSLIERRDTRPDGGNGKEESGAQVWFTGIVESIDIRRNEIAIRTERGIRTIRSRRPLPSTLIRPGDRVTVRFNGNDLLRVSRS